METALKTTRINKHKPEWYGDKGKYDIFECTDNSLSATLFPFSVIAATKLKSQDPIIKVSEVSLAPDAFDRWIRVVALARKIRNAMTMGKAKRVCAENGWLDGITREEAAIELRKLRASLRGSSKEDYGRKLY